ncbi:hypothetical protein GCM10009827_108790 [Dactylosporangium maewongense]|uniref:Uncharacterized protein n=1 Tax=Dactylosporangium maewongense TaxID=634393 RepID=A0ABP4NWB8_9ACTN
MPSRAWASAERHCWAAPAETGGDWEAKSLSRTADGVPYLSTKEFSPNLLGWIPIPGWVRDLADSFADFATQRTDARPCGGPAAPGWSSVDKRTTLVHLCSIANADRAEIQVQSNRRFYQWVNVPAGADYVWVEDQPDLLRRAIAKVTGHDIGGNVLLAGNGRFTAGYKQPAQTAKKDFNAYIDAWSAGLSVGISVLGLDPRTKVSSAALIVAKCVTQLSPFPSADGAKAFLGCFVTQALKNLENPDVALSAAKDLFGEAAYAKEAEEGLKQAKDRLRYLGRFLKVVGIITSTFPQLPDLFSSWGKDQPGRFTLELKGKPATPAPPPPGNGGNPPSPAPQQPHAVTPYDNYGAANAGRAMCRGNPGNSRSMPGGTVSQTFVVPAGVSAIDHVLVQIDPDGTVTSHLKVSVNGGLAATADATAAGDTHFSFGAVGVSAGQTVTLSLAFTATSGKIITLYTAGAPGGTFTASNSCPDGAPSVSTSATGLRAVVSGWS